MSPPQFFDYLKEALRWARVATQLTQAQDAATLDVLAAAQARAGTFPAAQSTASQAAATGQGLLAQQIQQRLALTARQQACVVSASPEIP